MTHASPDVAERHRYHAYAASRLAGLLEDRHRAAWLRGVADAAIDGRGGIHEEQDERVAPEDRAKLKSLATDPVYEDAYARGRAAALHEALDEAIAWLRPLCAPEGRS